MCRSVSHSLVCDSDEMVSNRNDYIYIYLFRIVRKISKNLLASEWSENAWRRKKIREIREKGLKTVFHRFISFEGGGGGALLRTIFSKLFTLVSSVKVFVRFSREKEEEEEEGKKRFFIITDSQKISRRKTRDSIHLVKRVRDSVRDSPSSSKDFKNRSPNESIFPFFFFPLPFF